MSGFLTAVPGPKWHEITLLTASAEIPFKSADPALPKLVPIERVLGYERNGVEHRILPHEQFASQYDGIQGHDVQRRVVSLPGKAAGKLRSFIDIYYAPDNRTFQNCATLARFLLRAGRRLPDVYSDWTQYFEQEQGQPTDTEFVPGELYDIVSGDPGTRTGFIHSAVALSPTHSLSLLGVGAHKELAITRNDQLLYAYDRYPQSPARFVRLPRLQARRASFLTRALTGRTRS